MSGARATQAGSVTGSREDHVTMLRYSLVCVLGLWAAAPALAGSWADALFDELSKDFGTVPRGPMLSHPFRVTNNTKTPVHLASVRVSCGCVTATILQHDLAPGQSTAIQAQMDTHRFSGIKNVTIYVTFDRPHWEEVRLWVQANGRDDITVTPDTLAFGQIQRGNTPSAHAEVTFLGNGSWQITEIQGESNYVQTSLKELRRTAGEVTYQVTAKLRPDAPPGHWYTDLWLKTNNPAVPRVRLPLTVEIESALSISPATVNLGQVKPGVEAERRIIVRGVQPFRITGITGTDGQLQVKDTTPESRPVHVLTIKLKPTAPGELTRSLRILTDLQEGGDIEFQAKAQVMP
jgi:hypothetical protein